MDEKNWGSEELICLRYSGLRARHISTVPLTSVNKHLNTFHKEKLPIQYETETSYINTASKSQQVQPQSHVLLCSPRPFALKGSFYFYKPSFAFSCQGPLPSPFSSSFLCLFAFFFSEFSPMSPPPGSLPRLLGQVFLLRFFRGSYNVLCHTSQFTHLCD